MDDYENLDVNPKGFKEDLFEDFLSTYHKHTHLLFWDQLYEIIEECNPGFLYNYLENLRLHDRDVYEICCSCFHLAGIPYSN